MLNTTFIYALIDPRDQRVRYIGKSDAPKRRLKTHLKLKAKNPWFNRWLSQLISLNLEPRIRIIVEVPKSKWKQWEKHWITIFHWAGEKITNIHEGGIGGAWNRGIPTPEHVKRKIRESHKHTHQTPEYRKKQSKIAKAQWANMTSEERKHMGRGARRPKSEEHKRKISETKCGVPLTDAHKKAISDGHLWKGKKRPEQSIALKVYYKNLRETNA